MNFLPEFESRQVLTSDELNWLTCYLDSQNRQSRKLLLGCGLIGGLQILLNTTNNSLQITNGCGLTSAGHIVSLQNEHKITSYTKIKEYKQKDKELLAFPYLSDLTNDQQDYSNSVNNSSIYFPEFNDEVYELFEETYNDAEHLKAIEINGKVAIAFAEIIQTELKDCEEDNCQDRGKKYTFNTKILLISEADALNLLKNQFQIAANNADAINKKAFPWLNIPNINILKPIFSNLVITQGINEAIIINEYKRCINNLAKIIKDNSVNIDEGLSNLNNFISIKTNSISFAGPLQSQIIKLIDKATKPYLAQIVYDYLWTIVKSYQEIQQTAQGLRANCLIEPSAFPNHVFLGKVNTTIEDWESTIAHSDQIYRHPFYSQYTQTEQALICQKISFQIKRLKELLTNFDDSILNTIKPTKVTPGASLFQPLSLQAIPYYLNQNVISYWNQNAVHPFLKQYNTNYYSNVPNTYNQQPLVYQGNNDFFRIEGVQGQVALTALNDVFKIRKANGLPYEVIMLRLNEDAPLNYSFNFSVNEDIESLYQVVRAELLKQININITYISGLLFKTGKYEEMKKSLSDMLSKYYEKDYLKFVVGQKQYYNFKQKESNITARMTSNLKANNNEVIAFKKPNNPLNALYQTMPIQLYIPNYFPTFFLIESFGSLIESIKKEEQFKDVSALSFYPNLLSLSKTAPSKGKELFYKTLRLYSALQLQALALPENFLEFEIETYSRNLNEELLTACNSIIPFLKNAYSDFIKNDAILNEVVKGEMLDYADRIKFDDDWVKMNQIDSENKKRNGGLGIENLLERFIQFHPGISHGCGVPNGGTFIMVYDKSNKVTADFYLPYILSSSLRPIQYTLLENKTITLSGLITEKDGTPIEAAKVTIGDNTVLTNQKGEFISLISSNEILLITISAIGFTEIQKEIEITDVSVTQNFTLESSTISKTTTVQFIDEKEQNIDLDIKLIDKNKQQFIAKNGTFSVDGEPKQIFQYQINDERFNSKSFNVEIKEEDITQKETLIAIKKDVLKDTWLTSDLNIGEKELEQLSVSFNGTKVSIKNGINTDKYSINYNKETLNIEANSEGFKKFTSEKIELTVIDAVIVCLKDKKESRIANVTKGMSMSQKDNNQFFTFTKQLSPNDLTALVDFHSGFKSIPKATLLNTNFYCFFVNPSEIKIIKDLIGR